MTTAPVLDLRPDGYNSVDGLRITNRLTHGTAHGYALSAQRRSRGGNLGLCMNLTAPDGRSIDMVGWLSPSASNAISTLSYTLSSAVTPVLRDHATPEQLDTAAQRLEAVLAAGLDCLARNISGPDAANLVSAAAEGMDPELFAWWTEQCAVLYGVIEYPMHPRAVALLHAVGFTPQTAKDWFGDALRYAPTSKTEMNLLAAYRSHGWSYAEFENLRTQFGYHAPTKSWAKVGPDKIDLAMRAGMSAREANALIRRGEWDEPTLNFLAGLRGNHEPRQVAVSA